MPTLYEQVCNLSSDLVVAETADLQVLVKFKNRFVIMMTEIEENHPELFPTANSVLEQFDAMLFGDLSDVSLVAAWEEIGRAVASLEQALAGSGQAGNTTDAPSATDEMDLEDEPLSLEDDAILLEFLNDQEDNLFELESYVHAMEKDPEELMSLKGKLHTLKGEVGILGMSEVAGLCHSLEDLLASGPTESVRDIFLDALEWLGAKFTAVMNNTDEPPLFKIPENVASGTDEGGGTEPEATAGKEASIQPETVEDTDAQQSQDCRTPVNEQVKANEEVAACFTEPSMFTGDPELLAEFIFEGREHLENADTQLLKLEKDPHDTEATNTVFRAFHTIKGVAGFLELTSLQALAHEAETMLDSAREGVLQLAGAPLSAIFDVIDALRQLFIDIETSAGANCELLPDVRLPALVQRIAEINRGDSPSTVEDTAVPNEKSPPEENREIKSNEPSKPTQATVNPQEKSKQPAAQTAVKKNEPIKVDAHRLDQLVDMIGELVIAETMVTQSSELDLSNATRLPSLFSHMDKITRELQELAMSIRMVPIRSAFRKMARLARDVAKKLDKKIEFVTKGENTELDKTVVDAIGDPLVHLIRNAVDHGLENDSASRVAAGKPAIGTIELRAFHQGGNIHIEIEDDGGGLDSQRILAKAIERKIVGPEENLSDDEIHNLIFAPGFSTAQAVTEVSGRGVGLDVVKRHIESLRGSAKVRSTPGKGSVFSICLPLTLAIIDGMVMRLGDERYVIPTVSIVRMIRPDETTITKVFDRESVLSVGDELVPLLRLDRMFKIANAIADESRTSAVIFEYEDRKCAFLVDELMGQQQVVIKPLGRSLTGTAGLSGGAIMPDGQVGLILDIAGLVKLASEFNGASAQNQKVLQRA
ncbi:MAG: two-component system chemotaxis sensor kinase CheA [Planctomycetota bacterium]|jgi:two-component system chemotaxis sensor kinase CheA